MKSIKGILMKQSHQLKLLPILQQLLLLHRLPPEFNFSVVKEQQLNSSTHKSNWCHFVDKLNPESYPPTQRDRETHSWNFY